MYLWERIIWVYLRFRLCESASTPYLYSSKFVNKISFFIICGGRLLLNHIIFSVFMSIFLLSWFSLFILFVFKIFLSLKIFSQSILVFKLSAILQTCLSSKERWIACWLTKLMRKAARFLKAIYRRSLQVRVIPNYYLNRSYSGTHVLGYTLYPKGSE